MKIVSAVGYTLRRVPVDSVVCNSMMFSNVIVDITISRRSFVFSQSCLEVPASLSDVGGLASPTQGPTPRESDTDCPFTVYLKSVESSGNSSITPSLYQLTVKIQDKKVPMGVDTGSSVTLLNSTDFVQARRATEYTQTPYGDSEKL